MKRGGPSHPKTLGLAKALGGERYAAVGILESLWHFTAQYARRGDIGRYEDSAIAEAIGWTGEPSKLIEALVKRGFLDRCRCHRLRVHDWPDHADQAVEKTKEVVKSGFLECYGDINSLSEEYPKDSGDLPSAGKGNGKGTGNREQGGAEKTLALAKPFPSQHAADVYRRYYPHGDVPGAMFKVLRPLVTKHGWAVVEPELDAYLQANEVKFHNWTKFGNGFGTWATGGKRAPPALTEDPDVQAFLRGAKG